MWHAQERYNSYTQPLINLASAHIVACAWPCIFLTNSSQFFFLCKVKTEEHYNLHNATSPRLFRFYVGENSRTFQDLLLEFKDFSRIFGKEGLYKTVWTTLSTSFSGSLLMNAQNLLQAARYSWYPWRNEFTLNTDCKDILYCVTSLTVS